MIEHADGVGFSTNIRQGVEMEVIPELFKGGVGRLEPQYSLQELSPGRAYRPLALFVHEGRPCFLLIGDRGHLVSRWCGLFRVREV